MRNDPYQMLACAKDEQALSELRQLVGEQGYSSFYRLLEGFTAKLKSCSDEELDEMGQLIATAKELFPDPASFSPSWDKVWAEYENILAAKAKVLASVPAFDRDGEWQIIMNNPATIQEVVCYPGLSFGEAAYLYAYFYPSMHQNEYLRLQKVQTLVMKPGL